MNIPLDKRYHIVAGAAAALAVQVLCVWLLGSVIPAAGTIAAYAAGWLKERWDEQQNIAAWKAGLPAPHGVEVADRNATAAGGLAVDIVTAIVALWVIA